MSDDTRPLPRHWRATKCYEGQGPIVLWQVAVGHAGKLFLVADATQRTFGLKLQASKPDDLKADGSVVAIVRKYAKTCGIGPIVKHEPSGDIWLPMGTTRGEHPDFWVQLAMQAPPEIRFIEADGTILVRKSSQGTYTKRRTLETPLPYALDPSTLIDLTDQLLAALPSATPLSGAEMEAVVEKATDGSIVLPEYQREARDRLARRVKTVRKVAVKQSSELDRAQGDHKLRGEAELLQDHLHEVRKGANALVVETDDGAVRLTLDPDLSPGQNLAAYFERAKKAKRADKALTSHVGEVGSNLVALEEDLVRLRLAPLAKITVEGILRRHKLPLDRPAARTDQGESLPFRTYLFTPPESSPIELHVGRSAETSDVMVKAAKANDHWIHAVGVTGSHVIVPAKGMRGELTPGILRMAAILALHHSKVRTDQKGEVYVTRRQHVRKRKGMAPGLWQVDKAETMFFRYDEKELAEVLERLRPS